MPDARTEAELNDRLWERVAPLLPSVPAAPEGPPPVRLRPGLLRGDRVPAPQRHSVAGDAQVLPVRGDVLAGAMVSISTPKVSWSASIMVWSLATGVGELMYM